MIKVEDLTYNDLAYNELNGVSFALDKGKTGVAIGPNGCGKSLLLKAIAEPHLDYSGRVIVSNFKAKSEPEKAKAVVGYLPKQVHPDGFLTAFELLETIAAFYQISPKERQEKILKLANELYCGDELYTLLERQGSALHQRVGIIASLIHQPSVLLWDEPLTNLDYRCQQAVLGLLKSAVAHGATVLIATNDLRLAEELADKIIVLRDGQIVAEGTMKQIHNQVRSPKADLESVYEHLFGG
ncbi:MAG TPA: ABC transporter ATP-binding protein [Candidatus Saccharimonadales bacterium]|nr:ABC transporter ATP-binding protein [Candidatus Saccharimonadales bacterium]